MLPPSNGPVLLGPKAPAWTCKCGHPGNWASRIRCYKCNGQAPKALLDKAWTNDTKARKAHPGGKGNGKGTQPKPNPKHNSTESKIIKELRDELKALKKSQAQHEGSEKDSEADTEDCQALSDAKALVSLLQGNLNEYKKSGLEELVTITETALENARSKVVGCPTTCCQVARRGTQKVDQGKEVPGSSGE